MYTSTGFALADVEYDLVWSDLGLGEMPYPVAVTSHGRTMEERAEIRRQVYADLAERGLAKDGRVTAELEEALRALASPAVAIDLFAYRDGPCRALAAGGNGASALAMLDGDTLRLWPLRDTALVGAIVDVLPDYPAGTGQSMSAPLEALEAAAKADPDDFADDPWGGGEDSETQTLVRAGVSQLDALALLELANSRIGGGQFGVSVAGRHGRNRRSESMLTWFDTPKGRYLMYTDGSWVTVAPAAPERLVWRLEETIKELGGGR